jgi:hypothetical protein
MIALATGSVGNVPPDSTEFARTPMATEAVRFEPYARYSASLGSICAPGQARISRMRVSLSFDVRRHLTFPNDPIDLEQCIG